MGAEWDVSAWLAVPPPRGTRGSKPVTGLGTSGFSFHFSLPRPRRNFPKLALFVPETVFIFYLLMDKDIFSLYNHRGITTLRKLIFAYSNVLSCPQSAPPQTVGVRTSRSPLGCLLLEPRSVLKPLFVGAAGPALQTPRQGGGGAESNLLRCPGGRNPVLVLDAPLDQAWFPGQQGPVRPQSALLERVPRGLIRSPASGCPLPAQPPGSPPGGSPRLCWARTLLPTSNLSLNTLYHF